MAIPPDLRSSLRGPLAGHQRRCEHLSKAVSAAARPDTMAQNEEYERALRERLARLDAIGDDDPDRADYSATELLGIAAFVVITSLFARLWLG